LHVYNLCVSYSFRKVELPFLVGMGAHLRFHMFGKRLWEKPVRIGLKFF
jgi:hypothetical protein